MCRINTFCCVSIAAISLAAIGCRGREVTERPHASSVEDGVYWIVPSESSGTDRSADGPRKLITLESVPVRSSGPEETPQCSCVRSRSRYR